MNTQEYDIMDRLEADLWWYRGLRDFLRVALARAQFKQTAPRILDAGCGTGQNLSYLHTLLKPAYLAGFDLAEEALTHARAKVPQAKLFAADICQPSGIESDLDLIISCDVFYIPGMAAALPGLKKLANALRPGGLFITSVPAYPWLFSEHDRALHTSQRFVAQDLRHLAAELNLKILMLTYRVFYLFPFVVAKRLPTLFGRAPAVEQARSDVVLPSPRTNAALTKVMAFENRGLQSGISYPWGSSVALVAVKEKNHA